LLPFFADRPAGEAVTTPWQSGRFRAYVWLRLCWGVAQQIMTVALGWLVYQRTQSTLALGLVGLSSFLPSILLSLVTGLAADRLDRGRIMAACAATMAGCAGALALIGLTALVWPIYLVVVVQGVARAFAQPAAKAMVPNLAPGGLLSRVIATTSVVQSLGTILGPAVGALLLGLGTAVPFAAAGGLALLALAGALSLGDQRARGMAASRPDLVQVLAGFRFVWSRPRILGAMGLDFIAVLFGSATALLPFYVTEVFHEGPWAMGALRLADAAGALAMAALLSRFPIRRHIGPKLLAAVAVFGLMTIGFGLSTDVYVGMGFLVVLGAADSLSMVLRNAMIQINTPDALQGRVAAVHAVTTSASNDLGEFESGLLAHAIGGVPAVVAGGSLALLAAIAWTWLFPAVRQADRLDERLPEG
jgi:MFS family permease